MRISSLIDRIKGVGGIMSSADWAQTVVILAGFGVVLAWIGVAATLIINSG